MRIRYSIRVMVVIVLFPIFLPAQKIWQIQDSLHQISVIWRGDSLGEEGVSQIQITRTGEETPFQTINPEFRIMESFLDSTTKFRFEDMNFDGFKDIRLLENTTISAQPTYLYWLYDPEKDRFVADSQMEGLYHPEFHHVHHLISTYSRVGFTYVGHEFFTWKKGKLVRVAEHFESWGIDGEDGSVDTIIYKYGRKFSFTLPANEFGRSLWSVEKVIRLIESGI